MSNPSQITQSKRYPLASDDLQQEKDPLKEELEQMKLEMVRELRDLKQHIKDSNQTSIEMLREIKQFNLGLASQLRSSPAQEEPLIVSQSSVFN